MLARAIGTPLICVKASPLFRAGNGNVDAFERFGPKLTNLSARS